MQRTKAKTTRQHTDQANAPISDKTVATLVDIGEKLLSGESLTFEDIHQLAQRYAQQHGCDPSGLIVCTVAELETSLAVHTVDSYEREPLQVVCEISESTLAVFSLMKHRGEIMCLYSDLRNRRIPSGIEKILMKQFTDGVRSKVLAMSGELYDRDAAMVILLRTLEILKQTKGINLSRTSLPIRIGTV